MFKKVPATHVGYSESGPALWNG